MDHPKHTKLHLDYTKGAFALEEEELIIAGEGPWGIPVDDKPFHYTIDNLLVGTIEVGLFDIVRCKDIGTDWQDREIVELVQGYKCWRGMTILPKENPESFIEELRSKFDHNEVQTEGGMGLLSFQCEPEVAQDFMGFLETTKLIGAYSLDPVNIN